MPRYVVERTFADGLQIPVDEQGAKACLTVVDGNANQGVTWVHSYVTDDRRRRPAAGAARDWPPSSPEPDWPPPATPPASTPPRPTAPSSSPR